MATPIAELFVSVGADVSDALAGLNTLSAALADATSQAQAATGLGVALVGAGLGITAALGDATKSAADFQEQMVELQNNSTLTSTDMVGLQQTLLNMATETSAPIDQLSEGLRHIANFGFNASDSVLVLDAAMKSAVSTGGNTAQTAEVLAAVLHEFGLSGADAANTMDELHTAAAEGNLTLEQFSASFGQVAAFAAAVGVPLDQAAAAMAAMTRHGFDAATAATQVKDQIVHLINPSKEAKGAINDLASRSGVDLSDALTATGLHARGLTGTLDLIKSAMDKVGLSQDQQTSLWLKLIPNIRGGAASFVLAGRGAEDFDQILGDMHKNLGITDDSFDRIKKTVNFQLGTLINQFHVLGITLGQTLLPPLAGVIENISEIIKNFNALPTQVQKGIVTVTAFAGAILLGLGALLLLAPAISALPAALAVVGSIFGTLAPIVAVGIGLFLALRQAWERDFGGIQEVLANFSNIGDIIQAALAGDIGPAIDGFIEDFARIDPRIREVIDGLRTTFSTIGDTVGPIFSTVGNVIDDVLTGHMAAAVANVRALAFQIAPPLGEAVDAMVPKLGELQVAFDAIIEPPVVAFFDQVSRTIAQMATQAGAGNPVGQFFADLGDALQGFGNNITTLAPVFGAVGNLFGAIFNLVGTLVSIGVAGVKGIFDALGVGFNVLLVGLQPLASLVETVITPFRLLLELINALAANPAAVSAIATVIQTLADALNALAGALQGLQSGKLSLLDVLNLLPGNLNLGGAAPTNGASVSHTAFIPGGVNSAQGGAVVNINGNITLNGTGDLADFAQAIANAIFGAAKRVAPPVDNSAHPALAANG